MLVRTTKGQFAKEPDPTDERQLRLRLTDGCLVDLDSCQEHVVAHAELPALIGRDPLARLFFKDPSMSRYHCEIRQSGEQLVIRDLESTNGTLVNGNKISVWVLASGDVITAGRATLQVESV